MTRNEMILQDRKNKMSYEKITEKYDLSENQVRKICGSRYRRVGGLLREWVEVKNEPNETKE